MLKTYQEVLETHYSGINDFDYNWGWTSTKDLKDIEVLVIQTDHGYDVWNIHPLRQGWQKVYSLPTCNPSDQVLESLEAILRLFE